MKTAIIGVFAASMLAFSAPAFAGHKLTPTEAEEKILEGCRDGKDASEEECKCVVKNLKTELPSKDYDTLINIVVFAMDGRISGLWDFVVENKLTLSKLKRFGEEMEAAGDRIEKICGGNHINLDINI